MQTVFNNHLLSLSFITKRDEVVYYNYLCCMDKKKCKECGKLFSMEFRNSNSLYCDENCRKEVRKRVNKANRDTRKERFKNNDKEFILQYKFKSYKHSAKSRGIPFCLSKEEFDKHYNKPCHYCGEIVNHIGIDRKDSSKGYSIDNIVDCCTKCNRMKRSTEYHEFIKKIERIYNNTKRYL